MMKKEKLLFYGTLSLRWYLCYYMITYGWAKLTLNQFGVHDPAILDLSLKEIDSFYVAWHLFGRSEFFSYVTGLIEIIGGILIVIDKTVIPGALLVLSILAQILIIDISFTTGIHGFALPVRVASMMVAALLILLFYKENLKQLWDSLKAVKSNDFKYKWWHFLVVPLVGFLMDFVIAILTYPIKFLLNSLLST